MPLMWLLSRLNVDLEAFQKYHQFLNKLFWKHYYSMWVDRKPQISVTFMHSERTMLVETENFIKRCLFLIVVAVQLFSCVQLFVTPWTAAHQASLSFTNSWSLLKHVHQVTDAIQPSHHLSPPSPAFNLSIIRVFSNELALGIRLPEYCSFSISLSNEYSGLISFKINWFDLLAVQETLTSLIQHHNSKASVLQHSAFFTVQLSHIYMTTEKTIALNRWTFVGKWCLCFLICCLVLL